MKREIYSCDICKSEDVVEKNIALSVVFITAQNEGRSTPAYLYPARLDLCGTCKAKILAGNMVFAEDAMGFNNYRFSLKEKEKKR